jgi:hypothetical protein
MAKDHIRDYTTVAGDNTDVDGVSVAEGTAPSNINDAIREVMSHQAELHADTRGGLTSAGSGGAYTLTSNETLAAYAQSGGLFVFEANHAMPDTATATLNIDAVGAKALRKDVSVALQQNDIKANQMVIAAYEAATDVFHVISLLGNSTSPITTRGDLIRGAAAGTPERVALGTTGYVVRSDGTDAVWDVPVTSGTAQATSAGTEFDFTSLPAWITRIVVLLDGVSLSGTDNLLIQIGDSGGVETTGYVSNSVNPSGGTNMTSTSGFIVQVADASRAMRGRLVIEKVDTNDWVSSHVVGGGNTSDGGGAKTLSGTLDRVRLTRTGTDTFDAGQVNILYE